MNLYGYCANDPINSVDVLGLNGWGTLVGGAVGGVVAGALGAAGAAALVVAFIGTAPISFPIAAAIAAAGAVAGAIVGAGAASSDPSATSFGGGVEDSIGPALAVGGLVGAGLGIPGVALSDSAAAALAEQFSAAVAEARAAAVAAADGWEGVSPNSPEEGPIPEGPEDFDPGCLN